MIIITTTKGRKRLELILKGRKGKTEHVPDHIIKKWDQYQYLGNCPPTPPLTQQ